MDFDEILCMQYCDHMKFSQTFQKSYDPWLMLKFQFSQYTIFRNNEWILIKFCKCIMFMLNILWNNW